MQGFKNLLKFDSTKYCLNSTNFNDAEMQDAKYEKIANW